MAEERDEGDLGTMLAGDLDRVDGPHPQRAGAPVAPRTAASGANGPRWCAVALLAAAAIGLVVLALVIAAMPREAPFASATPATVAPRPSAPPVASLKGRCPTLEDYAIASLQPSSEPAPPSFEPVAPNATPSTGLLRPGETGVVPAPDGSPGALVRVSNVRFCDRLPDVRPDLYPRGTSPFESTLLLAHVEILALRPGAINQGFIPGSSTVVANYRGPKGQLAAVLVFGMPGGNRTTSLQTGPGFGYRGTIAWEVPADDGQVTVDVYRADEPNPSPAWVHVTQFAYLAREGPTGLPAPGDSVPTSDPAATPTTGIARLGESINQEADGGTMPVVVDGIDQVPRYPGVAPAAAGGMFLEVRLLFGSGSGTLAFDPADWVIVGPSGTPLGRLELQEPGTVPRGWPTFLRSLVSGSIPPGRAWWPMYLVVEAPANGRVTLEYRPDGGPALVTWVVRDREGG